MRAIGVFRVAAWVERPQVLGDVAKWRDMHIWIRPADVVRDAVAPFAVKATLVRVRLRGRASIVFDRLCALLVCETRRKYTSRLRRKMLSGGAERRRGEVGDEG